MSRLFRRLTMVSMAIAMSTHVDHARAVETVFTDNVRIQTATSQRLFFDKTGASPQVWSLFGDGGGFVLTDETTTVPFWKQKFSVAANSDITAQLYDHTFRLNSLDGSQIVFGDLSDTNTVEWSVAGGYGFSVTNMNQGGIYPANSVPFAIERGTPSDTLVVASVGFGADVRGHVGIGTASPENIGGNVTSGNMRHLNLNAGTGLGRAIVQGQAGAESYLVHAGGPTNAKIARTRVFAGRYFISALKDDLSNGSELYALCVNLTTGNVGVKCVSPTKPFQVGGDGPGLDGNGAHVTPGGVWQDGSSRTFKDDIQPITSEQARETVRALQPVSYRYKKEPDEKYVGFIAEDVPELVATKDRKYLAPMDITAVLTRVVQEQDRKLDEQQLLNQRYETVIAEQKALLTKLSQRLEQLERKTSGQ